jgi:hypothetical protein
VLGIQDLAMPRRGSITRDESNLVRLIVPASQMTIFDTVRRLVAVALTGAAAAAAAIRRNAQVKE